MNKILFPVQFYFPSLVDGKANTIYSFNQQLSKLDFKIFVVSNLAGISEENIDKKNFYEKYNIKVDFLKHNFFSLFSKKQFSLVIKNDIVHLSSFFYYSTVYYLILSIFFNKKIVISTRGELYPPALKRKYFQKFFYILFFKLFQKKINFHATNSYEKNLIKKFFPFSRNISMIPNLINMPVLFNLKVKNQIVFLGRINPIKNIHILIEAFSILSKKVISNFELKIVGAATLDYEIEYLHKLKVLVKEKSMTKHVHFIGPKYNDEKFKIIAQSYCLVLPSKSENFGNVVVEALTQKTPVIVSKNTPWKVLNERNAGLWVKADIMSLSSALDKIISLDKISYAAIRENGYKLVVERFTYLNNLSLWKKFYNNLI